MISPARRRIVYQAIKAAILKGTDVEYWAITMYRQLDAGVLTNEQVAELEVLIDEYYNPPEPEPTPEPEPEVSTPAEDEDATAEEPVFESEPETQEAEQEAELDPYKFQGLTPAEVWASLSYRPTKAEYKLACDWLQIAYEPTATNAELRALLAAAAGIEE